MAVTEKKIGLCKMEHILGNKILHVAGPGQVQKIGKKIGHRQKIGPGATCSGGFDRVQISTRLPPPPILSPPSGQAQFFKLQVWPINLGGAQIWFWARAVRLPPPCPPPLGPSSSLQVSGWAQFPIWGPISHG